MIVKKATQPTRCKLCLQDADAEIRKHLLENRPCNQPSCPLRNVINTALDHQRKSGRIVFGNKQRQMAPQNGTTAIEKPTMLYATTKRTKKEQIIEYIKYQFKRLKKLWED